MDLFDKHDYGINEITMIPVLQDALQKQGHGNPVHHYYPVYQPNIWRSLSFNTVCCFGIGR